MDAFLKGLDACEGLDIFSRRERNAFIVAN